MWETVADRIRCEVLGKVLVVGGRASNFPESLRHHPRILWWDTQHFSYARMRELPFAVRWVVFTRWVDHGIKNRIRSLTPSGVQLLDWSLAVKDITNLLRAVEQEPDMLKKATPPVNGHKPASETLSDWLRTHVPADVFYSTDTKVKTQAAGLLPACKAAGYNTSVDKLSSLWYALRTKKVAHDTKRAAELGALKRSLEEKTPGPWAVEEPATAPAAMRVPMTDLDLSDPATPRLMKDFRSALQLLREQFDGFTLQIERMEAEWAYVMADRARLQVMARQGSR